MSEEVVVSNHSHHDIDTRTAREVKFMQSHGMAKVPEEDLIKIVEERHQQEISAEVFVVIVILGIVLVCALEQRYPKRFREFTLVFLWVYPLLAFMHDHNWAIATMLLLWAIWSARTLFVMHLARQKPLKPTTPDVVYSHFLLTHKVCYYTAMNSVYVLLIIPGLGILMIFFALYFGVLGRDCAETAAERISNTIGYLKYDTPPPNLCALCGEELRQTLRIMSGEANKEDEEANVLKLSCRHEFHQKCIRGWCLVGKKDTCPFCSEKVNLRELIPESPWNSASLSIVWIKMLSVLRWLVVWNPIIGYTAKFLLHLFHFAPLREPPRHEAQ